MNQPVPKLRVVPPRSDHEQPSAAPELTFQVEPFYVVARELAPLLRKHWREVGTHKEYVPFDPHWDVWMQQAVSGILHVLTVRADDALVGYVFTIVSPHILYKTTLHALIDLFWLDPRHRKGLTGYRMFKENEKHLRKLNVVRVFIGEKLTWKSKRERKVRVLFRRLGYKAVEVQYAKLLVE